MKAKATNRRSDKATRALMLLDRRREKREAAEAKRAAAKKPVKSADTRAAMAALRTAARAERAKDAAPKLAPAFTGTDSRPVNPGSLKIHPLAMLLPPMSPTEYEALHDSMRDLGQVDDAVLLDGQILDGRHRARVCTDLGKQLRCVDYALAVSPVEYVISKASHRNMDETQKACAAVLLSPHIAVQAAKRRASGLPAGEMEKGKTAEKAAMIFGVGARSVERAKAVFDADKALFQKCFDGGEKLTRAVSEIARRKKSVDLKAKATRAKASPPGGHTWTIHEGDCRAVLSAGTWKSTVIPQAMLIVADPPYNEGLDYGDGAAADKLPAAEYEMFARRWIQLCASRLEDRGAMAIIINDEWAAEHVMIAKAEGLHLRNWIKWYETFGTNCTNRFNRTSRHVLYFTRHKSDVVFHPEVFSRKSARQVVYNDSRAVDSGKLWDDVWAIPRLNDNAAERLPDFQTQLPEELILPLVMGLSDPGDTVLDPFSGSGTTVACCVRSGRIGVGIERNAKRAAQSRLRISGTVPDGGGK